MPNDEKPVDEIEAKKALFKHILNNIVKFHRTENDKNREYARSTDPYVNVFQREPHELVLHLTQAGYNFPDCVTTFKGAECVGWSIYRPPITRMREPFHLKFEDQYVEAPLKVVIEFEVPAKFTVSPTGRFMSYRPDPQNMSDGLFKKEHNNTPYNKPDSGIRFYSEDYRDSELKIAAEMERTLDVEALKTYLEIHEPEMLNEEAQRQARQYFLRDAVNKVEPQVAENFQELLNEEIEKQRAQGEVKSTSVDGGLTWTLDEGVPITKEDMEAIDTVVSKIENPNFIKSWVQDVRQKCDACDLPVTKKMCKKTSTECADWFNGFYCDDCFTKVEDEMRKNNEDSK